MANLLSLLSHYDSFAWVPTIKGALSLNLIGAGNHILGDVDKYAVIFKDFKQDHSEHYVAASSLMTVNDTKCGKKYCRTFRYMLKGTINVGEYLNKHFETIELTDDVWHYLRNEGVFVGRLAIVTELKLEPTLIELDYLDKLQELSHRKAKFVYSRDVLADSMESLSGQRHDMVKVWETLARRMDDVVNDEKNKRPTYEFDLLLTRDGILLIRDVTKEEWRNTYAAPNTADNYKRNIPIHRVFKMVANYVKYLFHSNYHHNGNHDTYLPASNLNGIIADNHGFSRVFRHQMNAFIGPVSRLKRNGFNDFPIEPNGILLYAKAFVNVCHNNGLIDNEDYRKNIDFIDIQSKEIDIMTSLKRNVITTAVSQANLVFVISGVLAFMVAVIKIITTFFTFYKQPFSATFLSLWNNDISEVELSVFLHHLIGIVLLAFLGLTLYFIHNRWMASKRFKLQSEGKCWLMVNSSLTKGKLSCPYRFYIWIQDVKLWIGRMPGSVISAIIYFLFLSLVLYAIIYFYKQ